jgi:hypothetical protein
MSKYYLENLHLYRGCEYGICMDFDIQNEVYLKISCEKGLELIDTNRYHTYVTSCIIGVDLI